MKGFSRAILAAAAGALTLAGCANNYHITRTSKTEYAATKADQVEILMTKPDRAYSEIATITVTDQKPKETEKMHKELRERAAKLGANAVILTDTGIDADKKMWANGVAVRWK